MVAKGNKDLHNYDYGYARGVKIQETEKWGRSAAVRRYGELKQSDMGPPDRSMPQDPEAKRGPNWADDHPNDWIRGANEDATTMPNFDRGSRGKK